MEGFNSVCSIYLPEKVVYANTESLYLPIYVLDRTRCYYGLLIDTF